MSAIGHQVAERSATYEVTQQLTSASDLQWTTMGEISDVVGGGTPKTNDPTNFEGGDVPWITPADLSGYTEKYISRGNRFITRKGIASSGARLLPAGTVLFTSRAPIGYVAIAGNPIATNQGFKSFVLKDCVLPEYVYWWLKGSKQRAEELASGTTFLELSGANAKKIPVPIVPLERQHEIVAEIEKQFSRLDEAVAGLKRVKANLKRYKAAILKAAVEGRLVPAEADLARREGRSYETGAQLLQRILETRRSQWKGKGKYKEPVAPDTTNLPELPEGWVWATLDQLTLKIADVDHKMPKAVDEGVPYVSTKDFNGDEAIGFSSAKRITVADYESLCRKVKPEFGDVLLSRYGTVGEVRLVSTNDAFQASYSIAILKRIREIDMVKFLVVTLRSEVVQQQIKRDVRATAQPDLGLTHIRLFQVPIPPLAEQHRIVAEVDRLLSIAREAEAEVEANLKRAQSLRQAILSRAFTGDVQ